ncbi:hypothetical protein DPMN_047561 [Dreissena polymorpha]|uniref:Uncharacterized protein n=1 Tax=Dreissena polymorpha TaxID=45954 RepID=A0A9D4D9X2_DREPO|nr:hypothetical protein DPMN_047561 [Dreissena polymorpha]
MPNGIHGFCISIAEVEASDYAANTIGNKVDKDFQRVFLYKCFVQHGCNTSK